jgi:hypothetical protein
VQQASPIRIPLVRQFGKPTPKPPPLPPAPVRAPAPRAQAQRPRPTPQPAATNRQPARPGLLAAFRGGPPLLTAVIVSEALAGPVGLRSEPPGRF